MKEKIEEKNIKKVDKTTYSKNSIINSKRYANRKDLLLSILKEDKEYSFEEVDSIIEKFMKGKVN